MPSNVQNLAISEYSHIGEMLSEIVGAFRMNGHNQLSFQSFGNSLQVGE